MSKQLAVCISDIHFNLNNLELASTSLRLAINKATELSLPLIIAGDLHDTKAIIRAEVANRLLDIFQKTKCQVYVIIGNHDLINEKGFAHSLNFLSPYVTLIDEVTHLDELNLWTIPYQSDKQELLGILSTIPAGSKIVMHQGFLHAYMGDYVQDKTSIDSIKVKDFTVISGHYHRYQAIGTVTYIGSPYTMSFGEAADDEKGYLILNEDGSHTREIIRLRKHVILEKTIDNLYENKKLSINSNDLVWVKVRGQKSELDKIEKKELGQFLLGHSNFKLDLILNDPKQDKIQTIKEMTNEELFDSIIESQDDTKEHKQYLKNLWREIL